MLLDSLEDRFLNPVVMAMLVHLNPVSDRIRHEEMRKVRDLLCSRKEEELSEIELYFKAFVLDFTFSGCMRDHSEIIRLYKVGVADTFLPSFIGLARRLYEIRKIPETTTTLTDVMEKGDALGCYSCTVLLAAYFYMKPDWDCMSQSDKHPAAVMNIKASKLGVSRAIGRCLAHGWMGLFINKKIKKTDDEHKELSS